MKYLVKKIPLVMMLIISTSIHAKAERKIEHKIWDKIPLEVNVPLFKKRAFIFEHDVKPIQSISGLDVIKSKNTLYVSANSKFDEKDFYVKDLETNEVIIFNLTSIDNIESPALVIKSISARGNSNKKHNQGSQINYLSLSRYAIQTLFSSERNIENLEGVNRIPMYTSKQVSLTYDKGIIARPLASWSGDGIFVTAIQLRNVDDIDKHMSPTGSIKGSWMSATFYPHKTLKSRNKKNNTTVAILTSNRPFQEALSEEEELM